MAKVCPKAINFATAESIHQLLALRPHPTVCILSSVQKHVKEVKTQDLGYNCACACKRMYLTFETFSNIWFWILLILGLWCLLNGQDLFTFIFLFELSIYIIHMC